MAVRLATLCTRRSLSPGRFLVLISVGGWVDLRAIVRLEWLGQLKNSLTSSGTDPATYRLVALCFNYATTCLLWGIERLHNSRCHQVEKCWTAPQYILVWTSRDSLCSKYDPLTSQAVRFTGPSTILSWKTGIVNSSSKRQYIQQLRSVSEGELH
jgi:hypothetical protein